MKNIIFDHVSIGGGVIGFNVIHDLIIKITKNKTIKNKSYNFLIFDKKINNIIGGVAYGLDLSSYGYFNNPIRLSPKDFVNFIKKNKKFKSHFLHQLKKNSGYIDKIWLKKYYNILNNPSVKEFKELYLPRFTYGIWQKFRLIDLFKTIDNFNAKNKFNITINLFLGEAECVNIKKEKNKIHKIVLSSALKFFKTKINIKKNDIVFEKTNQMAEDLISCFSTLGIGLNPPKKYFSEKKFQNKNYIWDFYAEGSTKNLIDKIKYRFKKNKKLEVFFIGYKAGLLESLPELYQLINKEDLKINITAVSSSLETLQKAEFVKKTPYKFGILKNNVINKVSNAYQIFKLIEEEFNHSIDSGFNKYHAWTNILSKNILSKMISRLSIVEKAKYEKIYFTKIRNITRFTYPYPLEIKDKMQEEKLLTVVKNKVLKIKSYKNYILVKTINKKYKADIVVNVSGPLSMKFLSDELPIVKNLKKQRFRFNNLGFNVLNNFEAGMDKNIYIPGTLSAGFNPNRITILNAILQNSSHAANDIGQKILNAEHKTKIFNFYKKEFNDLKKTNITKGGITCSKELMNIIQNNHKNVVNIYSKIGFKMIFDGKAGAGKSSLGKIFSEIFDIILIDTGYILKAISFKLKKAGISEKNIQEIQIKNVLKIIKQLNLKDLTNLKLDDKKLRPITIFLSKNNIVRKHFNKKIFEFSSNFGSFILTGRDTGQKIFRDKKSVKKFYIETSDKIAATRKSSSKNNFNTSYKETIARIKNDKKNTKKDLKSIIINNNKDIKYAQTNILRSLIL